MAAQKGKTPPPAEEESKSSAGESGAPAAAAPAKKGGKLKLIIIVVLALVVGGGGAVGVMKFMGGGSQPEAAAEAPEGEPAEPAGEGEAAPAKEGAAPAEGGEGGEGGEEGVEPVADVGPQNIEFKPFVVNLGGGNRFLKLTMSVEADTQELADEINKKMPQFRDLILMLLSSLSYDDISTLDGKVRLRNQMLNRINIQLSAGKVRNIYFSEFVMQ
ncbi:MAG: flagellar basal body-associated FliL family protein [Candidatus Adiutrix sp.]|jgi:flagellar FliL protein|nr:flagellar basal body-associated FliL family protein [Candidatus Adiutrix sp.]